MKTFKTLTMKTTIKQQIKAIQLAIVIADNRLIREYYEKFGIDYNTLRDGLNDAGSTLAAINLNPELKKHFDTTGQ